MENRKLSHITAIDGISGNKRKNLPKNQRETLVAFDRFNELEANCSLSTRRSHLETLYDLGLNVPKPFEHMSKEDLQKYVANESKHHTETTMEVRKQRMKRFFKWLEWVRVNKGKRDEEKHLTISCFFFSRRGRVIESHLFCFSHTRGGGGDLNHRKRLQAVAILDSRRNKLPDSSDWEVKLNVENL